MKHLILATLISFTLVGCGGGGGGDSTLDSPDNVAANGFWTGTFIEDGTTLEAIAIIYDGKIIATTGPALQGGQYSVYGDSLSATLKSDGGVTTTLSGTVAEQDTINGSFSTNVPSSGTLALSYSSIYDNASSQAMIAGSWESYYNDAYTTMTVSSDGTVTGSNDSGCIFNGTITTPDTSHALYLADIDISNCGADSGNLNGFATKPSDTNLSVAGMLNGVPYQWVFAN